jgi:hypothetical protein
MCHAIFIGAPALNGGRLNRSAQASAPVRASGWPGVVVATKAVAGWQSVGGTNEPSWDVWIRAVKATARRMDISGYSLEAEVADSE